jgi:hypothetical protein
MSGSEKPNGCCKLSLTGTQLGIIRHAQLTEAAQSLRAAADKLEEVRDDQPGGIEAYDVPGYLQRVRDDFGVLEALGYGRDVPEDEEA